MHELIVGMTLIFGFAFVTCLTFDKGFNYVWHMGGADVLLPSASQSLRVGKASSCSLEGWPESCIYKLLELQYDPEMEDFNNRFSSQPGVNTSLSDFGSTLCAPIPYEPMYLFFEAVGYTVGMSKLPHCLRTAQK